MTIAHYPKGTTKKAPRHEIPSSVPSATMALSRALATKSSFVGDFSLLLAPGFDGHAMFDGSQKGAQRERAGAGYVLVIEGHNDPIKEMVPLRATHMTMNIAEYSALIEALKTLKEKGCKRVLVQGDSLLVVNQVSGAWKAKKTHLADLRDVSRALRDSFECCVIEHIYREHNSCADDLANKAHP